MVLDYAEQSEVACKHNDGDDPCNEGGHGSKDSSAETSSKGHKESDECEATGDWVEDHNASKSLCGVLGGGIEAGLVDVGNNLSWVVSDVLSCAPILIGAIGIGLVTASHCGALYITYLAGATSRTQ